MRNTPFVVHESIENIRSAAANGLMHVSIKGRYDKCVTLQNGREVTEFINCSYLGLDVHHRIVEAYKSVDDRWGGSFCCARSRFSIEPNRVLEEELSVHLGGRAIVFPSVTTTHLSVLPLLASGILINAKQPPKVHLVFDRFAHASMQFLRPILAQEATVATIAHNDLDALESEIKNAEADGKVTVYIADSVYSMGGVAPLTELMELSKYRPLYLYIDDAHGTSIFGPKGQGAYYNLVGGKLPENIFLTFSMSKGFGCGGGGILLPDRKSEAVARYFGVIYSFSAPLEFSVIQACMASLELHKNGTVSALQRLLRQNVSFFDSMRHFDGPFSPIRMVYIGDEQSTIDKAKKLVDLGFFTSAAMFPVVPRGNAQLRICISSVHTKGQVLQLAMALEKVGLGIQEPNQELPRTKVIGENLCA